MRTMKRPNLRIICIEEGEETHHKVAENIINILKKEKFSKPKETPTNESTIRI